MTDADNQPNPFKDVDPNEIARMAALALLLNGDKVRELAGAAAEQLLADAAKALGTTEEEKKDD